MAFLMTDVCFSLIWGVFSIRCENMQGKSTLVPAGQRGAREQGSRVQSQGLNFLIAREWD